MSFIRFPYFRFATEWGKLLLKLFIAIIYKQRKKVYNERGELVCSDFYSKDKMRSTMDYDKCKETTFW